MKRVLITLIFSPDGVSMAYLYNDIALRLQEIEKSIEPYSW